MEGLYHDIINKELSDTFSSIDQLTLSYDGSRLKKVSDSASALTYEGAMDFRDGANKVTEYTWDANGRMASDANRGIYKIEYNELNLPREVKFNDGHVTRYTYAADGRKLRVTYLMTNSHVIDVLGPLGGAAAELNGGPVIEPQFPGDSLIAPIGSTLTLMTIDYSGNHIYRNDTLSLVLNDYGYLTADGLWRYHIKDWQGNVRAVIDDQGALLEINYYYPYGMLMGQATAGEQPYKYGGKELDRENGWDSYDVHARWLTSPIAQWTTQDPLAEANPWLSPYNYCAGDPVNNIDQTGAVIRTFVNGTSYDYASGDNGYAFYDQDGVQYMSDDEFDYVNLLTLALQTLQEGSFGKTLIDDLISDPEIVQIKESKEMNSAEFYPETINWDAGSIEGGIALYSDGYDTYRPPFIGLGHELAHISDYRSGSMDTSFWFVFQKGTFEKSIDKSELYASQIENVLRFEHNIHLRTHYACYGVGSSVIPYEASRIEEYSVIYKRRCPYRSILLNDFRFRPLQ